jgi:hypothetical protein
MYANIVKFLHGSLSLSLSLSLTLYSAYALLCMRVSHEKRKKWILVTPKGLQIDKHAAASRHPFQHLSEQNMSMAKTKAISRITSACSNRYIITCRNGVGFADAAMMQLLTFTHHYYHYQILSCSCRPHLLATKISKLVCPKVKRIIFPARGGLSSINVILLGSTEGKEENIDENDTAYQQA